jgi:ribosomal protein S18 acetylase RimI-like enzyme
VAEVVQLRLIDPLHPRYAEEMELRYRVLREPLGHPRTAVAFPFESESLHVVALASGVLVGCVLFHPESAEKGRLFQMAVSPSLQSRGIGRQLVARLEHEVRSRGFREVTLHARQTAVSFYERLGYGCFDAPFVEVGIPHRHMRKSL